MLRILSYELTNFQIKTKILSWKKTKFRPQTQNIENFELKTDKFSN